ncbi:MAG TPA: D-alanyl-D-alanine carboxypeptidase family protein, partial [Symbiobacteriaceae bacterium]|nr:D-alanyl-D-alanine carboxypeptidase family protein [Symbiobacteriaceae bacterium]
MRRLLALWIAITILLLPAVVQAEGANVPPVVPARAYLLMDAASGQVLYAHEGETQLPMASTTKIMTAILALERGKLDDVVTVGQKPYDTGGSTIYLDLGEQRTLHELLYALMLESANDSAVAIAEHLGGTEEKFVELMNAKALEIGAKNTHFVNSHGLHDPNHYTTAHDLALIARYAMQNPAFRTLVTTEEATIPAFKPTDEPRHLHSHNQLLGYYDGVTGVKNGYTEEALLTNVASAKRGDTELIAVVLGAQNYL